VPEFYEELTRIGISLDSEIFYDGMSPEDVQRLRS